MLRTQDMAAELRRLYNDGEFVVDKTGQKLVEIIGSSFIADTDGIIRTPNYEFAEREHAWYMSKSTNLDNFPGGAPELWKAVADAQGEVKSNYGYRIFSLATGAQYNNVLETLKASPDSRRAVMIYSDPKNHIEMKMGCRDFVCTNAVNYFIRNGKLHSVVQMRSNDAVFGYCNDFLWQQSVQHALAGDLGVEVGPMTWQAASLHVYERHFKFLAN